MEKKIDLHVHTTKSDGVLTPHQVLEEAVKNNVKYLAIADHDTIAAYTEKFFEEAKEKGINIIPAVEISTKLSGKSVHVLGYNIDVNDKHFINELYHLRNIRHDYLKEVTKKLEELGYEVDFQKLNEIDSVTKAHIADDVVTNKKNKPLLKETFGHIPNRGEFIETIMNYGCPGYVKKRTITPVDAADLIRSAGGTVILAHPVAYFYEDNLKAKDILKLINDMAADGIEGNYIYIDSKDKKHNCIKKWNSFATRHNLISTIGSDFHLDDGLRPLIGFPGEKLEPIDIPKLLKDLKKTNK